MSPNSDMNARRIDEVWKALGDPTRRRILDILAHEPTTTGEIVRQFSNELVRTAVMKHLDVLEQARLIRVEREGRRRWNHLQTEPLKPMATWLQLRSRQHHQNLRRLKQLTESKNPRKQNE